MKAERWQQVEEVFHAALERADAERPAFLDAACAGDQDLRREVESLLAYHEKEGSFIERPALAEGARILSGAGAGARLTAGQRLGPYEVISLLGAGGMGEVYLARDARLGRRVALKLLSGHYTRDEARLRRFRQEASTASALNHPNILTIYEVGEAEGVDFIATEFIDGVTLRGRLAGSRMGLPEALDVALQAASALQAAHAAGIVHRDVKPENVMVRPDGYVKVLDFGLAKLAERPRPQQSEGSEVSTLVSTSPGVVLGTVAYMSPEQARGQAVDARTDVWSLGVVLYEMATGRKPFEGETASDVLVSVLDREPPLASDAPGLPAELQRIVRKALRKDRGERYQTIKDMALDLKNLRRELELLSGARRPAALSDGRIPPDDGPRAGARTDAGGALPRSEGGATHPTSGVEYVVAGLGRHKRSAAVAGVSLIVALAGAGYGLYGVMSRRFSAARTPAEGAAPPFHQMKISKATTHGKASTAAVSPDGRYVAYTVRDQGRQSLWLRQVATNSNVQIVAPAAVGYRGLTFTPGGDYIYYVVQEGQSDDKRILYQVPTIGGSPKRLLANVTPVGFSPDGRRFAFTRASGARTEFTLMMANADGTGERSLLTRRVPDFIGMSDEVGVAWSPDGKVIACPAGSAKGGQRMHVLTVRVEDGAEQTIGPRSWSEIGQVAWLRDGSGLVMTAVESGSNAQIWHLSFPGGEARKVTNDINNYKGVGLTADSGVIATTQSERLMNVWLAAPGGGTGRARRIAGNYDGYGLAWTPDGRIVYGSKAGGDFDIWIMDGDGANPRQLTNDPHVDEDPIVTPDGRHILFTSDRAGVPSIWKMSTDGSNLTRLTDGAIEDKLALCSPDGRWLVYRTTESSGKSVLMKVGIDGGRPVPLTDVTSFSADVSPDGKLIAYSYHDGDPGSPMKIAFITFDGSRPATPLGVRPTMSPPPWYGRFVRWTPDGRAVSIVDAGGGNANIWNLPLDGRPPVQLTSFESDQVHTFDWSRDGKQLAATRSTNVSDVVLISEFR